VSGQWTDQVGQAATRTPVQRSQPPWRSRHTWPP